MTETLQLPNIFAFSHNTCPDISFGETKELRIKDVYLMCLKDDQVFGGMMDKTITPDVINQFILVKAPISCVKARKAGLLQLSKETAEKYFPDQSFECEHVLIFPTFMLRQKTTHTFLEQYKGISSVKKYVDVIMSNIYMRHDVGSSVDVMVRFDMIKSMIESKFWADPHNCNQNITVQFMARKFNLRDVKQVKNKQFQDIINKQNNYVITDSQYDKYVDPSLAPVKKGYRLYRVTEAKNDISDATFRAVVEHLAKNKDTKELVFFINYTLVSKEYCHIVLRNFDTLSEVAKANSDISKDTMSFPAKFHNYFKYAMFYAWICMYMEESIRKTKVTVQDRFVFTADMASHLPFYPFYERDLQTSPYLPIMIKHKHIDTGKNPMGINVSLYRKSAQLCGVVTTEQFKKRMNLFVCSKDIDMFEGMDWSNIAVTGSIMAACLPRYNPLVDHFREANEGVSFAKFCRHFYPSSDVDIMINLQGAAYIDEVHKVYGVVEGNIHKINPDENVKIKHNKIVTIVVNKPVDDSEAYKMYLDHMTNLERTHEGEIYDPIYEVVRESDIKVVVRETSETPFKVYDNIKYRISSPVLMCELELFSTTRPHISTVSRFYFPIVRAYFDGSDVFMLPSCVSACMTFINIDYRYFAGTKDPIEVINKYRFRGFGTIINNSECSKFNEYSRTVEPWKTIYETSHRQLQRLLGYISVNSPFYTKNMNTHVEEFYTNPFIVNYSSMFHTDKKLNTRSINSEGYSIPINLDYFDKLYMT